jgi:hypothetical protein
MPTPTAMHCYVLSALTVLLVVVVSSPLASMGAPTSLKTNGSTSDSLPPARRERQSLSKSPLKAEQLRDEILRFRPTNTYLIPGFHSSETSSLLSSALYSQHPTKANDSKDYASPRDPYSTTETNLLRPTLPTALAAVPLPVPAGELESIQRPTASVSSGCTMTVMGDVRNPCLHYTVWTSTVTKYSAVDCHGCPSIYVVKPKWHCPVVTTSGSSFTADTPFTVTSQICATTPAMSGLA